MQCSQPSFLDILHPGAVMIDEHHLPGRLRVNLVAYKLMLRNAGPTLCCISLGQDPRAGFGLYLRT